MYFLRLKELVKEAGQISLDFLGNSEPSKKADGSVITKADRAISSLVQKRLNDLTSTKDHILIDEEDPDHGRYLDSELLNDASYIWALDPIDGTRPYANGMPFYGISLGLLKDQKPWMGMVYFPLLKECFYHDGEQAYFVKNAFQKNEVVTRIVPVDHEITSFSILLCSDLFFKKFEWQSDDCHVIIPACAVVDLCWPTIGRACGAMIRSSIWDFAGSWPIFRAAGLELRSIDSGEVLDFLDLDRFNHEQNSWKLKTYNIISTEQNFSILQAKFKQKE